MLREDASPTYSQACWAGGSVGTRKASAGNTSRFDVAASSTGWAEVVNRDERHGSGSLGLRRRRYAPPGRQKSSSLSIRLIVLSLDHAFQFEPVYSPQNFRLLAVPLRHRSRPFPDLACSGPIHDYATNATGWVDRDGGRWKKPRRSCTASSPQSKTSSRTSRAHALEKTLSFALALTCSFRFQHAWSIEAWPEALHRGWSECCRIQNRTRYIATGSGTHSLRRARLRPMVELSVLKRRGTLSLVERRFGFYATS
jgi:hypothetical protein